MLALLVATLDRLLALAKFRLGKARLGCLGEGHQEGKTLAQAVHHYPQHVQKFQFRLLAMKVAATTVNSLLTELQHSVP